MPPIWFSCAKAGQSGPATGRCDLATPSRAEPCMYGSETLEIVLSSDCTTVARIE